MIERYISHFDELFLEAIVDPVKYSEPIKKKFDTISKYFTKNKGLKDTCIKLSALLRKYHIKFIPESTIEPNDILSIFGFNRGGCLLDKHLTIVIYCNENLLKLFNVSKAYSTFERAFFNVLKHELIHRGQYIKISNKRIREKLNYSKNPNKIDRYLNDKQEIMAYAWQIIEYYRLMGLSKEKILTVLKRPRNTFEFENNILSSYIRANDDKVVTDDSLKLLYKYAYLYATEG